jgi:eukaryotic-like serine/threonine-protein kinase
MSLAAGTRLGSYEIVAPLGTGGMGEVYRARDAKLNRNVAIKVLLPAFVSDPDRLARFGREAQLLASLNHPNIANVHGLEDAGEVRAIVMELVEGPTLADRIAEGALTADEAVPIAKQIAEALEAAHERGIIHRDLKPANIKVREDGRVKVLDFGLAKALDETATTSESNAAIRSSPTVTSPAMTMRGVILGTAAYMSPEQAKGRIANKRSDIWSFGCVLYEMFTGRRAFDGEDISETMASVLKSTPDWNALPPDLPATIRALIEGCLRKEPRDRIGDISTALFLLTHWNAIASPGHVGSRPQRSLLARTFPVVALVASVVLAGAAWFWKPEPSPALAVVRFAITLPPDQGFAVARQAIDFSSDGTRVVYTADGRLFIRSLSEIEPRLVLGAEPAIHPVFSPDGQSVVYWSESLLKRIAVSGGGPVRVCQAAAAPSGITWQDDDAILFSQPGTGIMRVSANGGNPEVLVRLTSDELASRPELLPDHKTLLFTVTRRTATADPWQQARIVLQPLNTGERKTLIEPGTDGRYVSSGHIVYAVGGTLYAIAFDAAKLAVTGVPVPVLEGVRRVTVPTIGSAHFAVSNSGSLAYLPGPAAGPQQNLMVFDRKGGAQAMNLPVAAYAYPRVSPDGKRLALEINDGKEVNIAVYELSGAASVRRLTFGGNNRFPIWSADGRRLAFQSDREGDLAVFWQAADGGRADRLTRPEPGTAHVPESWHPRGDTFLFSVAKGPEVSLWRFSVPDRQATRFGDVRSASLPTNAVFSPDGRWVAYQRGEPEQAEGTTFVEPYPPDGTKFQIARGGRPAWSREGTELFFIPAPNRFMAAKVQTQPTFTFANPVDVPRGFGVADPTNPRPYDVTSDGRFIGVGTPSQTKSGLPGPPEIHVVLNWYQELKRLVPIR